MFESGKPDIPITRLEEGMEVIVMTLLGQKKGIARKRHVDRHGRCWEIDCGSLVAFADWSRLDGCYVSEGAYSSAGLKELERVLTR